VETHVYSNIWAQKTSKENHKKQLLPCSFHAVHEQSVEAWEESVHPEFLPAGVG
jgi:hypothetical protein